jgi:hypothetical protein
VKRLVIAAVIGTASLTACGGGGTTSAPLAPATLPPSSAPSTAPSAQPAPTATPQSSLASIDFSNNAPTTLTVTENGFTGTFRETDTCNPLTGVIAAVSVAASAPAGSASYTVTPQGVGTCQITVSDTAGNSVAIPVTVSAAAITIQ